jgi:hypothetical protein
MACRVSQMARSRSRPCTVAASKDIAESTNERFFAELKHFQRITTIDAPSTFSPP